MGIPGEGVRSLHADHDHSSVRVRGLLCQKYNHAIGLFLDDPMLLVSAAAYLQGGPDGWRTIDFTVYDTGGQPIPLRSAGVATHTIEAGESNRMSAREFSDPECALFPIDE
jgi:hypothetical protein